MKMNKNIVLFIFKTPFQIFSLLWAVKKINKRAIKCRKVFYRTLRKNGLDKKIARKLANFYGEKLCAEVDIFEFLKNFRVP